MVHPPFYLSDSGENATNGVKKSLEEDMHHDLRRQLKQFGDGSDFALLELRMAICLARERARADFARLADVFDRFVVFKHLREQQVLVHRSSSFRCTCCVYATVIAHNSHPVKGKVAEMLNFMVISPYLLLKCLLDGIIKANTRTGNRTERMVKE